MYTYDDVLDALHDLELKNPNVLLSIPENEKRGKKTFPKDHIPGSPDTTKYLHNKTSRDCLLRCRQDGNNLDKILYEKSIVYVKTPQRNNHCFYQAVLSSMHESIKGLKHFHSYTAVHLKYQMLLHLMKNIHKTELMKEIFGHAWFKIIILNTCPKAWILKFLHSKEWGDAYSMLGLIAHMWKIKITLINYLEYDAEFVTYGPYCGRECHADIYIIYNGWSHYTATGTN